MKLDAVVLPATVWYFQFPGLVSVHIGVEPAMTGVSRFGELRPTWKYVAHTVPPSTALFFLPL